MGFQRCMQCLLLALSGLAVDGRAHQPQSERTAQEATDPQVQFDKFKKTLSNVTLVGRFTVTGQDDVAPKAEKYTIRSVKKTDHGDYWLFHTRIQYGDQDVTLPLPLEVKWAGGTPMITLTDLMIPGLGTFSARVVIHDNKYAGTWRHGDVGGHMFGNIVSRDAPRQDE